MFGRTRQLGLGLGQPRAAGKSSRRRPPFADLEVLTHHRPNPRTGLVSVVLHAIVIALLAYASQVKRLSPSERSQQHAAPAAVTMMYLPPKQVRTRPKPPRPEPPPAPAEAAAPKAAESPLPAPTTLAKAPEHDDPAAMSPERKPASQAGNPETQARKPREVLNDDQAFHQPEDLMVSEARRLFGPKLGADGGPVAGPVQAGRPVAMVGGGVRCAWETTDAGSDAGGPANGVVEGVVRTERGGEPVPGAFLQLLGTGSATFSDDVGHYRLTFDPRLVDRCHSQIVRVTAPGYRARTMVLAYGTWSDNIVDMRGR
jgi:hypothetical protein